MKSLIVVALLIFATFSSAAEIDAKSLHASTDRQVADAIEIQTLPNGEVITRLVSTRGLTARQFWVDSVYGSHRSMLVFGGQGADAQRLGDNSRGLKIKQQPLKVDPTWNDYLNVVVRSAMDSNY